MSSPFSTIEEFNSAADGPTEGAIYTFANTPIINNIALLVAVGLFVWFLIKTYSTGHKTSSVDKSLNHLSTLIVASGLSLVAASHRLPTPEQSPQKVSQPETSQATTVSGSRGAALSVVGMVGMVIPAFRRTKAKRSKYRLRNFSASNLNRR